MPRYRLLWETTADTGGKLTGMVTILRLGTMGSQALSAIT
jgi:hypothetical protein